MLSTLFDAFSELQKLNFYLKNVYKPTVYEVVEDNKPRMEFFCKNNFKSSLKLVLIVNCDQTDCEFSLSLAEFLFYQYFSYKNLRFPFFF